MSSYKFSCRNAARFLIREGHCARETVDLTGDVNNSDNGADEYNSCSSVEEEEIDDDESQSVATLDREANFLLGRVSAYGRAVRFNSRLMFS